MAYIHKTAVSVATSATALLTAAEAHTQGLREIYITPATDIYVGNAAVTTATGFLCPGGVTTVLDHDGERHYGICASGTVSTVVVMKTGKGRS